MRKSNIELLRIIAMLMVLVLHATFESLGYPSVKRVQGEPLSWMGLIFTGQSSICCVDIFVLITGWFGTHFKVKNLFRLLFQVAFITTIVNLGLCLYGNPTPHGVYDWFRSIWNYWFVNAYVILYFFSPSLNAFVEKSSERELRHFLCAFYLFAIPFSFCLNDLNRGFSAVSFMGLYLLGRYLKLYLAPRLSSVKSFYFIGIYLGCSVLMTLLSWSHYYFDGLLFTQFPSFVTAYTNPFTMLAAVSLLLFFNRLDFSSSWVNQLAMGSFAAYLLHQQMFVRPFYFKLIKYLNTDFSTPVFLFLAAGSILGIYLLAVIIDRFRNGIWQSLISSITSFFSRQQQDNS